VTLISAGSTVTQPAIQLTQTALTITHQTGSASPPVQNVGVSTTIGFREYTASTTATWIRLISTFNPAPAATVTDFAPGQFSVVMDATGLLPGTYVGTVDVSSSGLPSLQVPVSLIISTTPSLNAQPSSIIFDETTGNTTSVTITSTAGSVLPFSATASSGTGWLSVSPSSGSTASGAQALTISANTTGLVAGVHAGAITIAAQNSPTLTIPVRISIIPGAIGGGTLTFSPESITLTALVGGSNPSANVQIDTESGITHNFAAAASG
jgi:hypothetical protein